MDDIGSLFAYVASQRGQFTQVADDTFAGHAVADNLHAILLKGIDLLFNERHKVLALV